VTGLNVYRRNRRVDSEGTSEIALGDKGAERLLGKGHLLAKLEDSPSLVYAQVPYATPDEIGDIVTAIERDMGDAGDEPGP
jgi:DNA segregation ATPase FtsK/SpoIIIE, S-DNA-T family